MTSKEEAKALIEAAVTAAIEASMRELDEKLQAAVNLGVTIGAAAGADVGAKAAVKAVERERKAYRKKQYDWKYQNTKLLLRNYRRLNAYYENAIFSIEDAEEADESFEDIMRNMGRPADEEIFVESIQKNYLATRIIMFQVVPPCGGHPRQAGHLHDDDRPAGAHQAHLLRDRRQRE